MIVTTGGHAGSAGITANAVTSVTAEPPTMLFCLNKTSRAAPLPDPERGFCINTLASAHQELSDIFAGRTEHALEERFAAASWGQACHRRARAYDGAGGFRLPVDRGQGNVDAPDPDWPPSKPSTSRRRPRRCFICIAVTSRSERLFAREELNFRREDLERGLARGAATHTRTAGASAGADVPPGRHRSWRRAMPV